jgi:predicted metal-dependent hydrolase
MSTIALERSEIRFGTTTIGYSIQRSARRATVSIAIDPTHGVLVTAPEPAPVRRLDDIVHAKASWIVRRLKHQSDRPPAPSAREFVSGETFLYLGRQYRLRTDLNAKPGPLRLDSGWLRVPVPRHLPEEHRSAFVRAALVDWYRDHATRRLPARTATWAKRLGVSPPEVIVTEPQKRWGSASASGAIRLSWRVIQAPGPLIDYVVVHELVHLEHPNHTRAFWAAFGRVMPDYEIRKARLVRIGPNLDW